MPNLSSLLSRLETAWLRALKVQTSLNRSDSSPKQPMPSARDYTLVLARHGLTRLRAQI